MPTLIEMSPDQLDEMRKTNYRGGSAATAAPKTSGFDNDAELFQMLNGGQLEANPYLPYLEPRVVTGADGKKFLRIPKNQELVTLGKFFDERGKEQYKNTASFVNDYLKYKQDQTKLGYERERLDLDKAKTQYDINKPYYAPKKSTTPKTEPAAAVTKQSTASGGLSFFQKQKDGTKKPITVAEYSQVTGQNVVDILSQSKDPNDKKIIADTVALESAINEGKITADEALAALQTDYPWVYGSSQ